MKTRQNETRYIVTDVSSIPVCRIGSKSKLYEMVTKPGCGLVEWYSQSNNYSAPVFRDKSDKTQVMYCEEYSSAVLYTKYGQEFCISAYEEIPIKDAPKQSETAVIILSDGDGYSIWAKDMADIKVFVTYDENGLIDTYRFDNWNGKPYDDETEISFSDLQSEDDYESTSRAEIVGTFEHQRRIEALAMNKKQEAVEPETVQVVSEPVVETATPPAPVTETARPEPAPVVEKRPISAIRAEVCRVANRLRIENAWSRSMSMRESWAMVKSGRAMFQVKGTSSQALELEWRKADDLNYGTCNAYHVDAWRDAYPSLKYAGTSV